MATQIASTSVLKNWKVVNVYLEPNKTPSKRAKSEFKMLEEMFKR